MENWKKVTLCIVVFVALWHLFISMTPQIKIAGPLLAKPADPGYVWADANNTDGRFFWQHMGIKWIAGAEHPDYKAETAEQEGVWNPLPGYMFVDKTKNLETIWQERLLHPDYMAWSDDVEGKWIPVTGYRFVYEGDTFIDSVWDPGKRYDDLKVISLPEKDQYKPFPGYKFLEPGKSLKVAWTPGLVNSDNSQLVSGTQEGSWNINHQPTRNSHRNDAATWVLERIAARAIYSAF